MRSDRREFLKKLTAGIATTAVIRASTASFSILAFFSKLDKAKAQMAIFSAWRARKKIVFSDLGKFYTSNDSVKFSSGTTLPLGLTDRARWFDIAWNGTVYCAVGEGSAAATSTDLTAFTSRATPFTEGAKRIIANGSTFIAISAGTTNLAATSSDGITWTSKTLPVSQQWVDICWNGSVYCAVAQLSSIAATSPDGTTWTQRTLPSSVLWTALAWNGTVFCLMGEYGEVATSPDGVTWTQRAGVYYTCLDLQVVGSDFYLLHHDEDLYIDQLFKSSDNGVTFTPFSTLTGPAGSFGIIGSTILANSGYTGYYSNNSGSTWSLVSIPVVGRMRVVNSKFFVTGSQFLASDSALTYSTDGIAWTNRLMPAVGIKFAAAAIAKSPATYCMVPKSGSLALISSNGINWSTSTLPSHLYWKAVVWNGSLFCAVSDNATGSNVAATSPDGVTWTSRTLPSTGNWADVCWNGSVFCTVRYGSSVAATSPDGITWTARALPSSQNWCQIVWNGSVFCAINNGNTNVAATSPDGITWTSRTLPATTSWSSIVWTGTKFVVLATAGSTASSSDGVTWAAQGSLGFTATYLVWNGVQLSAYGTAGALRISHNLAATWSPTFQTYLSFTSRYSIVALDR